MSRDVDADFFSCVSRGWRVPSPRSDITGRHCVFGEMRDRRFLSDELLGAEPDRCTEPPFAPLVCLGVSVSFVSSWRSVSFVVRRRAVRIGLGRFEQKATKRTKGGFPLCFLRFLLWICGSSFH